MSQALSKQILRILPILLLMVSFQLTAAVRFDPAGWKDLQTSERSKLLTGLLLTSACIYTFDTQINKYYATPHNTWQYDTGKSMSDLAQFYGASNARVAYFFVGLTSAVYTAGLLTGDRHIRRTAGTLSQAMAYALIASFGTKMIIGRARPALNEGSHRFFWFEFSRDKNRRSFLSGHTATAFALMTVLAEEYPEPQVWIPAYLFATCVGAQRIVTGAHWTSDVIVGGLLGYFIGKAVVRHSHHRLDTKQSFNYYFYPLGLTLTWNL